MSEQDATMDEFVDHNDQSDWSTEKLDSLLTELLTGNRPTGGGHDEGEYISIGGTQIDSEGYIDLYDLVYIPEEYFEKVSDTQLQRHDILMVKDGANTGDVAIAWEDRSDIVTNEHVMTLRLRDDINPPYTFYYLLSHEGWKQLKGTITGSAQEGINKSFAGKADITYPPLEEQRKIASVLYTVDQTIQKTQEIVDQIQHVKSGLLQDLFDKSRYDDGNLVTVGDLGKWGSGSTPSKKNSDYWGGHIPWLAPKDIFTQERNRIKTTEERLSELGASETNLYPKGSIAVVVRSGVLDRMLPLAKIEAEMAVNQDIKILVPHSANPDYLLYAFEAYSSQIRQRSRKQGTTWVDSIQMLPFMRFELPVPSPERQNEIVEHLRPYDKMLITEKEYLNYLKRFKKGLMQDLFSGEVRTHNKDIELADDVLQHG